MMNIRLMREEDLFQVTSLHDVLFKQSFNPIIMLSFF